ncbi:hypothetical protein [Fortiea contorta]|uniref:hypothetical protein n=1 Tax=Fortiea contorta TaxID=1892405 RepID=UPI0012B5E2EB|nr:hypothetical protein [Fortiea contorta]
MIIWTPYNLVFDWRSLCATGRAIAFCMSIRYKFKGVSTRGLGSAWVLAPGATRRVRRWGANN